MARGRLRGSAPVPRRHDVARDRQFSRDPRLEGLGYAVRAQHRPLGDFRADSPHGSVHPGLAGVVGGDESRGFCLAVQFNYGSAQPLFKAVRRLNRGG